MAEPKGEGGRAPQGEAAFIGQIVKDPRNPPKTLLLVGYLGRSSEDGHTRLYLDPELDDYVEIPNDAILHTEASGDESPLGASYVWINRAAEVIHGEAGSSRHRASFLDGRITQDYLGQAAGGGFGGGAAVGFGPHTIPLPVCWPTRFLPFCPPSIPIWRCPTRHMPFCPRSVPILTCPSNPLLCRPSVPVFSCPKSVVAICPSVAIRCPSANSPVCGPSVLTVCPSVQAHCPSVQAICPTLSGPGCTNSAVVQCPTFGACPSAVDACPSAPGGCTFDPTIFQGTTVVNPGGFAGEMGGYGNAAGGYGFGYGG